MIASAPFSYLHVFRYSSRPGTKAADMKPCHTETITERSAVLRELSRVKREAFEAGLVGCELEATVESDRPAPGWVHATTGNYATVLVPDTWEQGTPVLLTPEGVRDGTLYAERVQPLAPSTT